MSQPLGANRARDAFPPLEDPPSNRLVEKAKGRAGLLLRALALLLLAGALVACPAERRAEADSAPGAHQDAEKTQSGEDAPADAEPIEDSEPGSTEDGGPAHATDEEDSSEKTQKADAAGDDDEQYLGPPRAAPKELVPGEGDLYGVLRTNHGAMVVRFFEEEAPVAVANFVGLATGQMNYRHHETNEIEKGRFYDGTIFHRVIPGFMIQGGDPTGTGRGGPGYRFDCEEQELEFDRPGLLGMANAGRNTNGSQFFITEQPTPHLSGNHTIFGTLLEGQEVLRAIARVPRARMDRPEQPVVLKKVEIIRSKEKPSR